MNKLPVFKQVIEFTSIYNYHFKKVTTLYDEFKALKRNNNDS